MGIGVHHKNFTKRLSDTSILESYSTLTERRKGYTIIVGSSFRTEHHIKKSSSLSLCKRLEIFMT